jgi:ribose transport system ATP-binding protein
VEPVFELRNIAKTFVGQTALDGVDLALFAGQIRGLAGHNGSGKSTLIKIMAGFHNPDPGSEAKLDGSDVEFGTVSASHALGLRFVHQELDLIDELSIFDNFFLTRSYSRPWLISMAKERSRIEMLLDSLGIDLDVRQTAGSLKGSQKVGVAIAKAIDGFSDGRVRVLVLDEVDAFLPAEEKAELFSLIRNIASYGVAILYVSHNLSDVLELADVITVLRSGRVIWSGESIGINYQDLAGLVIGAVRNEEVVQAPHSQSKDAHIVALSAQALSGWLLDNVDVAVERGEIVGFTGLSGSGWEEISSMLGGAQRPVAGTLQISGTVVTNWSPRRSSRAGVALIPGDRRRRGVIAKMTVRENITLPSVARGNGMRSIRIRKERRTALHWIEQTGVVPALPESAVETFSGGNQQKVLLARALRSEPTILILDDPFQGVDVGAVKSVSNQLRTIANSGVAIVVTSSDPDDLVNLCDRIVVIRDGRVVAELRDEECTVERVVIESGAREAING